MRIEETHLERRKGALLSRNVQIISHPYEFQLKFFYYFLPDMAYNNNCIIGDWFDNFCRSADLLLMEYPKGAKKFQIKI